MKDIKFGRTGIPVTGIITDIETRWRHNGSNDHIVTISYEYLGDVYSNKLSYATSDMYVGKPIEVIVDPTDATQFHTKGQSFASLLLIALGALAGALGIVRYVKLSNRYKNHLNAN